MWLCSRYKKVSAHQTNIYLFGLEDTQLFFLRVCLQNRSSCCWSFPVSCHGGSTTECLPYISFYLYGLPVTSCFESSSPWWEELEDVLAV